MTPFNQTYYTVIKSHMSRIGVWPDQSKYVRFAMRLLTAFVVVSFSTPQLIRLHDVWGNGQSIIAIMPTLLCAFVISSATLNCILRIDEIKVILGEMEKQWKMVQNTLAVTALNKCAERGCYFTKLYAIYINIALTAYFIALMSPVILDFVNPLNETRPKFYFYEAEYGIDPDKYYWLILTHGYTMAIVGINMTVTLETIYVLLIEHACGIFEVVGFNLELATGEYMANKKEPPTIRYDNNYQKICDCIIIHKEAISFATRLDNFYSFVSIMVMGVTAILISVTGVQILINLENLSMVVRIANFTIGQIFHLYINSIPSQRLIDSSLKIHTFVCNLNWYDMSAKAQKLLIPILIRSNKPCFLTAGKVYIWSMENFGLAMRTAGSYLMIFAQLL